MGVLVESNGTICFPPLYTGLRDGMTDLIGWSSSELKFSAKAWEKLCAALFAFPSVESVVGASLSHDVVANDAAITMMAVESSAISFFILVWIWVDWLSVQSYGVTGGWMGVLLV